MLKNIAIFFDACYFQIASRYYALDKDHSADLSVSGFQNFVVHEVAAREHLPPHRLQVSCARAFAGSVVRGTKNALNRLEREWVQESAWIDAGVVPVSVPRSKGYEEKGVDITIAIHAMEVASSGGCDIFAIVTGDADFIPLIHKIKSMGVRVMVLSWKSDYKKDRENMPTHVPVALHRSATYSVMFSDVIKSPSRKNTDIVKGLFDPKQTRHRHSVNGHSTIGDHLPEKTAEKLRDGHLPSS